MAKICSSCRTKLDQTSSHSRQCPHFLFPSAISRKTPTWPRAFGMRIIHGIRSIPFVRIRLASSSPSGDCLCHIHHTPSPYTLLTPIWRHTRAHLDTLSLSLWHLAFLAVHVSLFPCPEEHTIPFLYLVWTIHVLPWFDLPCLLYLLRRHRLPNSFPLISPREFRMIRRRRR